MRNFKVVFERKSGECTTDQDLCEAYPAFRETIEALALTDAMVSLMIEKPDARDTKDYLQLISEKLRLVRSTFVANLDDTGAGKQEPKAI